MSTSRRAAASLPVTSPIRRGKRGSGRLRAGVEEPFGGQRLLQPLDRGQVRAEPEPLEREGAQPELALGGEELGPAEHVDALALGEVELERVERPAGDRGGQAGAVAGSLSVKKTLPQRSWRRSSVTSPSIHSVGRRASQSATPRLKPATVYTLRSP